MVSVRVLWLQETKTTSATQAEGSLLEVMWWAYRTHRKAGKVALDSSQK